MGTQGGGLGGLSINALLLIILLVVLGIISFRYYAYVDADRGITIGTGIQASLLPE